MHQIAITLLFVFILPKHGAPSSANLSQASFRRVEYTICPDYASVTLPCKHHIFCAGLCTQNSYSIDCRGYCFDSVSQTCTIYGLKVIEGDYINLNWISFRRFEGVELNYTATLSFCKEHSMAMPVPVTAEEQEGMLRFAQADVRLDLNDFKEMGKFTTFEEEITPDVYFWADEQPNNVYPQDCVFAHFTLFNGFWNDYGCQVETTVFCQYPKPFRCNRGLDLNHTLESDTTSCYVMVF